MELLLMIMLGVGFFLISAKFDRLERLISGDLVIEYEAVEDEEVEELIEEIEPEIEPEIEDEWVPPEPIDWEQWVTRKFFPIVGSISLLVGTAYFVILAITNDWVGPLQQVGLGVLASTIALGLGEWLREKYPQFFAYITATGIAGLILITFVARSVYDMISAPESLLLYSGAVALGGFLSVRYDRRELANLAILGGLVAPFLTQAENSSAVGLMCFLFVLSAGGFAIATYKKWPELLIMLLAGVTFFETSILFTGQFSGESMLLLSLIYAVHLLLGSASIVRMAWRKDQAESSNNQLDIILLISSLLIANFFGHAIFSLQAWDNFGFFVLLQGFCFLALGEWSAKQKISGYKDMCVLGTLACVLFATVWELKGAPEIVLGGILSIEAVLLTWFWKESKNRLYQIFAVLTLLMSIGLTLQVEGIWWSGLAVLLNIMAVVFLSVESEEAGTVEFQRWLAAIVATGLVLWWNSEHFMHFAENSKMIVLIPSFWAIIMALGARYFQVWNYSVVALLLMAFVQLIGITEYDKDLLASSVLLLIGLVGTGYVLWSSVQLEAERSKSFNIVFLVLGLLNLFAFGLITLEEPERTLFWLATGVTLLFIGLKKDWSFLRYTGLGIILFIIGKLYIVDIWQWEIWMRFVAFFVLGIALLFIAFNYQKFSPTLKKKK